MISQDEPADSSGDEASEEEESGSPENPFIEMEIRTSTLMELAAWCRELGLSDSGTRDALATRLREHYNLSPPSASETSERIITIESARTTEYFTIEAVNEEYARLKGDVIISLKDGSSVHRIKAWEILFNRTRNVITASGNVEYIREEGGTVETFKGASITVNLDDWASIFVDGVVDRSLSDNATAYRFAGTVISRNNEEVTILTKADITNPQSNEVYWSIRASKVWLLPGNDFAFLNAVLRVGNIPLLYIPFFYYPSEEIIFHPVLGYKTREGTFLQTTTYILGRPKTSVIAENSITKIFGSASENMEMKREGVFLRSTGERTTSPNDTRLSLLLDLYANLGAYLGTELALPKSALFGEINLSAGIGFTRNVYSLGNLNTPYPLYDGKSEWNRSMFFSLEVPFRYRFNLTGSFQIKNGSLSWSLPYYSDPYVDRDFMRRSETLDWLSMLREGAAATQDEASTDDYLSSYEWRLNGSFNPQLPKLAPYINSVSISSITSSLLFNVGLSERYKIQPPEPALPNPTVSPNPGIAFFFPNRFTILSVSASVSGTPFSFGSAPAKQQGSSQSSQTEQEPAPGDALLPDLPVSPWENAAAEQAPARNAQDAFALTPPALGQSFSLNASGGPRFSFEYLLTPSAASELQFRSSSKNWPEQEDINWGDISTILSRFRGDGNLGLNVSHSAGGAYSGSLRFSGTGSWQDYMLLNEESEEFAGTTQEETDRRIQAARNRAYNETYFTSSWDFSTSVRPFFRNDIWGNTNVQYNIRGLLAKTNVNVDQEKDDPLWDWAFGKWEKDEINTHQVSTNIAANIRDFNQTLNLSVMLPPRDTSASVNATFRAWISETSIRGGVQWPSVRWKSDEEEEPGPRAFQPIYFTQTFRIDTRNTLQFYVVYTPEENTRNNDERIIIPGAFSNGNFTTLTANLSLWGISASYSATYAQPYKYNYNGSADPTKPNGWILIGDRAFNSREFRLGYADTFTREKLWNGLFSFSVNINTDLSLDLQRYTNSKLNFNVGLNFGISNFLTFRFTARSENAVIFRYIQNLPFFDMPVELYLGQEKNFFVDLLNSFRFDNDDLRRSSGFKLKALDLSIVHHLGDWNASLTMRLTPELDRTTLTYKFRNDISFIVQWIPIGEIKTQIDYSGDRITIR